MMMNKLSLLLTGSVMTISLLSAAPAKAQDVSVQKMADAIFSVIEADRAVYTKNVVQRLQNDEEVITAEEHWKEESALPLPAQMLRMGAERVSEKKSGFSYALLSLWAINKQNKPRSEFEQKALESLNKNGKNVYGNEELGGKKYFTAVYPDVAVSKACVTCHNDHIDSPKKDFKVGEMMGGLVIRIPLD